MSGLLPAGPLLWGYLVACLMIAITPGPGVLYIVTRALAHGRRCSIASVLGVALGNLGNAIVASIGLAALSAASALAFEVVKYAGALYLVFLGVRTLRTPQSAPGLQAASAERRAPRIFRDGFVVALLNPKTAVFFAAFLPQFLSVSAPPLLQGLLLGSLFVAIAAITDTAYALTAQAIGRAMMQVQAVRALGRYLSASALICLGALTACTGAYHAKS